MSDVYVNKYGGKQSRLPYRPELLDPSVMLSLSRVLSEGAEKYGVNNWHNTTQMENIQHALVHIFCFLMGEDTTLVHSDEDHLTHALCRLMFACSPHVKDRSDQTVPKSPASSGSESVQPQHGGAS